MIQVEREVDIGRTKSVSETTLVYDVATTEASLIHAGGGGGGALYVSVSELYNSRQLLP